MTSIFDFLYYLQCSLSDTTALTMAVAHMQNISLGVTLLYSLAFWKAVSKLHAFLFSRELYNLFFKEFKKICFWLF